MDLGVTMRDCKFYARGSPMKRLGQPDEIVNVMLMLCARENNYMNAQAIAVDGRVSAY
jgi:NAD(P)-dependent dehydrogenase (short-subunit alcohol dehydrogenase family)